MIRCCVVVMFLLASIPAGAAGPAYWDSPQDVPFTDGSWEGAALDARGGLVPGFAATEMLADSSLVLWSVAVDADGDAWAGSGHDGRVWRVAPGGEAEAVVDLPCDEVFAVLPLEEGVLVGGGPGGQLFRVTDDGASELLATVPGGYVWDLARGPEGRVYLATGNPAEIFELGADGELVTLATLPCSNALDLAVIEDGSLLVAAQGPGRVFHVLPDERRYALLLALEQDEVRQIAAGPDGWYALGYQAEGERPGNGNGGNGREGTGNDLLGGPFDIMVTADADVKPVRSVLYRLDGPTPYRVWSSEHVLATVVWSDDHGWLAAGAGEEDGRSVLFGLGMPNARRPLASWDGGDALELLVTSRRNGADGVLVAQANPGRLTRLDPVTGAEARFVSPPLDGRHGVRWSRLTWEGTAGGEDPRFQVRIGMSPEPDATWTDWRDLSRGRDLALDDLPVSRCLQWRVSLPSGSRVGAVTVSAVEPNLPPVITHFSLEPAGEMILGSLSPAQDNVTQLFASGLKVEYNLLSRRDGRAPRERAGALRPLRTFTWHASDPNRDRLRHRLAVRAVGQDVWQPVGGPVLEQVMTWDTSRLEDGWYEVRLITDDSPDNPGDQVQETSRFLGPLPVDNTAPELSDWSLTHQREGFTVEFTARDEFGPLAGAEVILPDGNRLRLDPEDGVCDSARERFDALVTYPAPGATQPARPWTVEVQAWDLQGNVVSLSGVLP